MMSWEASAFGWQKISGSDDGATAHLVSDPGVGCLVSVRVWSRRPLALSLEPLLLQNEPNSIPAESTPSMPTEADQHLAAGEAVSVAGHWRLPVFAALAASHHHTIGNADVPYSGRLSGWENRSQCTDRNLP